MSKPEVVRPRAEEELTPEVRQLCREQRKKFPYFRNSFFKKHLKPKGASKRLVMKWFKKRVKLDREKKFKDVQVVDFGLDDRKDNQGIKTFQKDFPEAWSFFKECIENRRTPTEQDYKDISEAIDRQVPTLKIKFRLLGENSRSEKSKEEPGRAGRSEDRRAEKRAQEIQKKKEIAEFMKSAEYLNVAAKLAGIAGDCVRGFRMVLKEYDSDEEEEDSEDSEGDSEDEEEALEAGLAPEDSGETPRRPGRPKKQLGDGQAVRKLKKFQKRDSGEPSRKRGRPKKNQREDGTLIKRGRPKKRPVELEDSEEPSRKRGRPKMQVIEPEVKDSGNRAPDDVSLQNPNQEGSEEPLKKRGRPKKQDEAPQQEKAPENAPEAQNVPEDVSDEVPEAEAQQQSAEGVGVPEDAPEAQNVQEVHPEPEPEVVASGGEASDDVAQEAPGQEKAPEDASEDVPEARDTSEAPEAPNGHQEAPEDVRIQESENQRQEAPEASEGRQETPEDVPEAQGQPQAPEDVRIQNQRQEAPEAPNGRQEAPEVEEPRTLDDLVKKACEKLGNYYYDKDDEKSDVTRHFRRIFRLMKNKISLEEASAIRNFTGFWITAIREKHRPSDEPPKMVPYSEDVARKVEETLGGLVNGSDVYKEIFTIFNGFLEDCDKDIDTSELQHWVGIHFGFDSERILELGRREVEAEAQAQAQAQAQAEAEIRIFEAPEAPEAPEAEARRSRSSSLYSRNSERSEHYDGESRW